MNKDKQFEKKVIKPVVKEVKKYNKKHHAAIDSDNLRHLKIQTANVFVRIIVGFFGFLSVVGGGWLLINDSTSVGVVLIIIGILFLVLGIRGRKRELQTVLNAYDFVNGIDVIIDVITDIDI